MSAIDFEMALERQPDQKGDRVRVTMSGKFLSYKQYRSSAEGRSRGAPRQVARLRPSRHDAARPIPKGG